MTWLLIVNVVLIFVALYANKVARDALIADTRPWLSVDVRGVALVWEDNARLRIKVDLANYGGTPATETVTAMRVISYVGGEGGGLDEAALDERLDALCDEIELPLQINQTALGVQEKLDSGTRLKYRPAVFPDRPLSLPTEEVIASRSEIEQLVYVGSVRDAGAGFTLIGCARYAPALKGETRFAYELAQVPRSTGGVCEVETIDGIEDRWPNYASFGFGEAPTGTWTPCLRRIDGLREALK